MDSFGYSDHMDQIVVFTMEPPSRMAAISRKFSIRADVSIRFTESSSELTFLYHEKDPNNRDLNIYLAQFNPVSVNASIIIRREIDAELQFNGLMKKLHSVESSILTGIRLEDGIYIISFEFAAEDTHLISSVIMQYVDRIETLKLKYLGPLVDYFKFNRQDQDSRDITTFSFSVVNSRNDENIPSNSRGRKVAMLKIPTGNDRARFLVNEIDKDNETEFQSYTWQQMESENNFFGFYKSLVEKLYSRKIILMRSTQIIEPGMTTFYFAFSNRQSKDFIKCLSEITGASGIKDYRINYLLSE